MFPLTLEASKHGIKRIILPKENAKEAAIVQDIEVIGVESLNEVINYLNNKSQIERETVDLDNVFSSSTSYNMDFKNVKGQRSAKRALEVAAAGRTQCYFNRLSTEVGKTFMAKCLPSILPDLSLEEALEVTKIHSVAGLIHEKTPIITKRVFRAPHHTVSGASLIRWWKNSKARRDKPCT